MVGLNSDLLSEDVVEAESRFEALHDVRMGNTIVENAESVAIEISPDVEQQVIQQEWRFGSLG